ncbi:hypothetical protein LJB78_00620, partial [Bacteroidales bacterium OttesenSCG-928-J16]|nr:hypothetical protein [Bacteroidales bacterium OttesenSCG-928-J16]
MKTILITFIVVGALVSSGITCDIIEKEEKIIFVSPFTIFKLFKIYKKTKKKRLIVLFILDII